MADDETSGVVEEVALVLTSYEKTRGDVEETRRGPKGPFVVPGTSTTMPDHACMMVTVRVADSGRAAPPSRRGGLIMRAAGENFARGGVKMAISFGKKRGER